VQDLADEMREIKGALQSEVVVRRDLESRLNDERSMMEAQFKEEKRALELIADSNLKDASMDEVMKKLQSSIGSSEKVLALKAKVEKLEKQIQKEREENEAIQEEVSTSFMAKIVKSDEMIRNLKERLGDD
jgi:3-methyladenine DNA glycosylase Tag